MQILALDLDVLVAATFADRHASAVLKNASIEVNDDGDTSLISPHSLPGRISHANFPSLEFGPLGHFTRLNHKSGRNAHNFCKNGVMTNVPSAIWMVWLLLDQP